MAVTAHNITKIVDLKCSFYKVKKLNLKILTVRFQYKADVEMQQKGSEPGSTLLLMKKAPRLARLYQTKKPSKLVYCATTLVALGPLAPCSVSKFTL